MPLTEEAKKLWGEIRNPNCEECPLHEEAQTVCLVGDGPVPAKIMIVGEAPGYREDEVERPFAGKSGKLLDAALEKVGLSRDDAFITNVVKCRPPDNAPPTKGQMKACRHYLDAELKAVDPEFILTVGNSALSLIKKSGIMKHRGELFDYNGSQVLPTVHPAAVLRNPRYEGVFNTDLNTFSRLVRGESGSLDTRTFLVQGKRGLTAACQAILKSTALAYDVETTIGGEFAPDAALATIAIAVKPGVVFVVPIMHPEARWRDPKRVIEIVAHALAYTNARRIAHNAKFDDRWVSHFGGDVRADFDTMIAAHMLDENRFKALKYLAQLLLGVDPWADIDTMRVMEQPLRKLARYNAKDADYTLRLYYVFRQQLTAPGNERTLRIFSKLLMPASRALTDIERTGMYVDQDRLLQRRLELDEKLKKIDRLLVRRVGHPANWNSPQQVAKILFGELGYPMFELTKKGAASTKESVMLRLSVTEKAKGTKDSRNIPALILKHRELQKNKGTYFDNWAALTDENSRIHTAYKITGTVTGRLSSGKQHEKERGFNAQQIPRNPWLRSVFGAPEGWKHFEADFSQIELRIAAHLSQEPTMKRLFQLGEDIHLATAVQVTGKSPKSITSEERKKAKAVNFGFLYGMGYKKFVDYARDNYGVHVELEEAKAVRNRFFETFSGLRSWHERQRRLVRNYGRVQSLIGRVRHLPDIESGDEEIRQEAERQAINSPVQGLASDMMLMALNLLHERMPPDEAKVTGTVHDSILGEIREDKVDYWVPIIRKTMENLPLKKMYGAELSVPIVVDIKVGDHWSEGALV